MNAVSEIDKVNWRAVLTFIVLACVWSWPLFWLRDMHPESWVEWRFPMPLKNTLLMWGPGIAALICFRLFRKSHIRTITFAGQQKLRALAFYFLPMIALAIVGAEYVLRWLPVGTHRWDKFVTPQEFAEALRAAGLAAHDTEGMAFDPLRDQWRLSSDTGVNYFITADKRGA